MNSIFHTEAPEKVRTLPEKAPRKAHNHELVRDILWLVPFFALLALLTLGCKDIFTNPENHYPQHRVNVVEEPAAQPGQLDDMTDSMGQASQTTLQPVTQLAENRGLSGTQVPGALEIVASNKNGGLTNQNFIYYYWDGFFSIYDQMGSSLNNYLNLSVPFDQQLVAEGQTWHQYLTQMAVTAWHQTDLLYNEAVNAGHQLSAEAEESLNASVTELETYAQQAGFADGNSYLQQMFDPCADVESYLAYNRRSLMVNSYVSEMYQQFYDAVYDPNAEVRYCVNVRHILLQPNEGEEMSAVKTRAEDLLKVWQQNPTEDNFAALATERTTDPGSQSTGGLYEDIYPGQMVQSFNDWCFDESRQVGDTGIVETEYGYHLMYFSGHSETPYADANHETAQEDYNAWLDGLFLENDCQSMTEKAVFTEKVQ